MLNSDGSFAEVNKDFLNELVSIINRRMDDNKVIFEHLVPSKIKAVKHHQPYHASTFLLLRRIISDLCGSEGQNLQDMKVLSNIFSNDISMKLMFSGEDLMT